MRKILFSTFFLLFLLSCEDNSITSEVNQNSLTNHFETEIGKVIQGQQIITYDVSKLKRSWSDFLTKNTTLSVEITSISIHEDEYGIHLRGKDKINAHTAKVDLVRVGDALFEKIAFNGGGEALGGQTVTCTGCKSTSPGSGNDCIPKNTWCTACSKGDCTKTVTTNSERKAVLVQDKVRSTDIGSAN